MSAVLNRREPHLLQFSGESATWTSDAIFLMLQFASVSSAYVFFAKISDSWHRFYRPNKETFLKIKLIPLRITPCFSFLHSKFSVIVLWLIVPLINELLRKKNNKQLFPLADRTHSLVVIVRMLNASKRFSLVLWCSLCRQSSPEKFRWYFLTRKLLCKLRAVVGSQIMQMNPMEGSVDLL